MQWHRAGLYHWQSDCSRYTVSVAKSDGVVFTAWRRDWPMAIPLAYCDDLEAARQAAEDDMLELRAMAQG